MTPPLPSAALFLLAGLGLASCALIVGDYGVEREPSGGAGSGGANLGGASAACDAAPPDSVAFLAGYGQKAGFLRGNAIALDASGNTVIAGTALGSEVAFGEDTLESAELDPQGGLFVASIRPDGNAELVRAFSTGGDAVFITVGGVAVFDDETSGERAIYVSGQYEGSLELGAVALDGAGNTDSFVTKLSSTGEPVWARSFGDAEFQQTARIAVDKAGDVLVAARGDGTFALGGACSTPPDAGAGIWTFKLRASDGECMWLVKHPVGWSNNAIGFAYDRDRDVAYVGAETVGDPYFSSVPGRYEAFVYAFRGEDGSAVWPTAARFGPMATEDAGTARWVEQLRVGPCGDLYALGQFERDVVLGELATLQNESFDEGAETQLFLAKLAPESGAPVWAVQFPHSGTQLGQGLAAGPFGLLAITGEAYDLSGSPGFDFGDGPMPQNGDNPIASDAFVAVFADDGQGPELLLAQRLTDHGDNAVSQRATDAVFDDAGALYATGTFENSIQFSRQVGDSVDGFSYGAFVVQYGQP